MHVICLNFKEVLPVNVNLYLALGLDIVISKLSTLARWQSGDAADCKSVYAGSIPARASIINFTSVHSNSLKTLNPLLYKGFCFMCVRRRILPFSHIQGI